VTAKTKVRLCIVAGFLTYPFWLIASFSGEENSTKRPLALRTARRGRFYLFFLPTELSRWEFTVPKERRDEHLKAKLRREAPGILNWMLKGLADVVANNYKMTYPKEVEAATSQYRESQDVIGQFVEAKCVLGGDRKIPVSDLFTSFKIWADWNRVFRR
jgi:hypothetical protein